MDNRIKVTTHFDADHIRQTMDTPNDLMGKVEQVIQLREEGVRQALIELGWKSPEEAGKLEESYDDLLSQWHGLNGNHTRMTERATAAERELDALAAQLRSVQSAFDKVVSYGRFDNGTTNVSLAVLRNVQAALDADPGACLARRDAQMKAEVLEEFHNRAHTSGDFPGTYWDMRRELRRQAEEGE